LPNSSEIEKASLRSVALQNVYVQIPTTPTRTSTPLSNNNNNAWANTKRVLAYAKRLIRGVAYLDAEHLSLWNLGFRNKCAQRWTTLKQMIETVCESWGPESEHKYKEIHEQIQLYAQDAVTDANRLMQRQQQQQRQQQTTLPMWYIGDRTLYNKTQWMLRTEQINSRMIKNTLNDLWDICVSTLQSNEHDDICLKDFYCVVVVSAHVLVPQVSLDSLLYELQIEWPMLVSSSLSLPRSDLPASTLSTSSPAAASTSASAASLSPVRMNYSCFCGTIMKLVLVWTDTTDSVYDLLCHIRDELIRNNGSSGLGHNLLHQHQYHQPPSNSLHPRHAPRKLRPICVDATEKRVAIMAATAVAAAPTPANAGAVPPMDGGKDVATTLVEGQCHPEEPYELPGQSLQQRSAEKNARQVRWSSASLPTNGAGVGVGAVAATNAAMIGTIGTVAKSMSQLSIDDAIDAKRRAARKTKRHKKLKLRHYQIRRQREATGVPLVSSSSSSSSSSEDDSEEEYELNRTIGSMEENDRVWWPR
jgi:hypothetical protein